MTESLFALHGRVALVTGANGTLGRHFARVLHAAGAAVILAVRRTETVAAEVVSFRTRAVAVPMDVCDENSVAAGFAGAAAAFGVPDIIISNAGIATGSRFMDQSLADWDAVMDVNLRGTFLVGREAARRLAADGRPGCIVNIGSILGERVVSGLSAYEAAKAGLGHLTRAMAVELARDHIRVNALAPGYIATGLNDEFLASDKGQAMVRRVPQRRLGTPDDLTGPLLLLVSAAGAHMTGVVLTVDGGHSISPL